MSYLLSAVILALPQAQAPHLTPVWAETLRGELSPSRIVHGFGLVTDPHSGPEVVYDLQTGRELLGQKVPRDLNADGLFATEEGIPGSLGTLQLNGKTFSILWSNKSSLLAMRPHPATVIEYDLNSARVVRSVKIPHTYTFGYVSDNLARGAFCLTYTSETMSHHGVLTYVLLTHPLRISSVPIVRVFDTNDYHYLVGISAVNGFNNPDVLNLYVAVTHPLACGDAFTGKLRWSRPDLSYGVAVSDYVVASEFGKWQILSRKTGKALADSLPEIAYTENSEVGSDQDRLYVFDSKRRKGFTDVKCYRISPASGSRRKA